MSHTSYGYQGYMPDSVALAVSGLKQETRSASLPPAGLRYYFNPVAFQPLPTVSDYMPSSTSPPLSAASHTPPLHLQERQTIDLTRKSAAGQAAGLKDVGRESGHSAAPISQCSAGDLSRVAARQQDPAAKIHEVPPRRVQTPDHH